VADLSEQVTALRAENVALATENAKQKSRISEVEPELQQAQKELREANDLLMEMRLELNNWKEDILGFRSEMRDADQAQLEALLKILQLLGGEIMPENPPAQKTNHPAERDPNE
jgi:chromosome segregation ATPase